MLLWHIIKLKFGSRNARFHAAEALGKIGDPRAVEPLITALKNSDSGWISAKALGNIGDARAVEPLIAALKNHGYDTAAEALGNIGDPRAIEPLITVFKELDNQEHKYHAALHHAEAQGESGYVLKAFESCLRSIKSDKYASAAALCAIGSRTGAVEPLIAVLKYGRGYGNNSHLVVNRAKDLLAEIEEARSVETLINALKDGNIHDEIIGVLYKIGDRTGAVEPFIAAMVHGREWYRENAARALCKIGAVESLIATLNDSKTQVRGMAATALGWAGDARAVEPLVTALDDSEMHVRGEAATALGCIGDARAVEPLITALKDTAFDVRKRAAEALAKLCWQPCNAEQRVLMSIAQERIEDAAKEGEAAVEPLILALNVRKFPKVKDAVCALSLLNDVRAVEPLIKMLVHAEPSARAAAAMALRRQGQPHWSQWVEGDGDDWSRLEKCGDERAIELLMWRHVAILEDEPSQSTHGP